jgi:hypothetical protein
MAMSLTCTLSVSDARASTQISKTTWLAIF